MLKRSISQDRRTWKEIRDNWTGFYNNTSSHTALVVFELLVKRNVATVPQLTYSSVLVPANFLLFSRIKETLKGTGHETLEAVNAASVTALKKISIDDFHKAFNDWEKRCKRDI